MSYTLPSGTTAVPGQKILSARYNAAMTSIASALNLRREATELQPSQYGGTGKDTSSLTGQPELLSGEWFFPKNHVNVVAFGAVGNGVTDDTAAIQAAMDVAIATNSTVIFPPGVYPVSTMLTASGSQDGGTGGCLYLQGSGVGHDAVTGTIIKWVGADALDSTLLKINGIGKLVIRDLSLQGNSKTGKVLWLTHHVGGTTYSGYGWVFENVNFAYPKASGYGVVVDGTTDMARMTFRGCQFLGTAGSTSYYTANQNTLTQTFFQCGFYGGAYGLNVSGDCHLFGCELVLHSEADIYAYIHNNLTLTGCWSEQSMRCIKAEWSMLYASITLTGCSISSYPWSYWKLAESGRIQPIPDLMQWGAIWWDRPGALNLIGCQFSDPFLGLPVGVLAPLTSEYPGVSIPAQTIINVNNIGSFSQLAQANPITEGFIHSSSSVGMGAQKSTSRKSRYASTLGTGKSTLLLAWGNIQEWTMTGATEIAISPDGLEVGDTLTLILKQNGSGAHTLTWTVAPKLTGGAAFVPTVTAGARSMIRLLWDGTVWNEMFRALDLK